MVSPILRHTTKGLEMKGKRISACVVFIIFLNCFIIGLSQALQESKTIPSFGSIKANVVTYFKCSFSAEHLPSFPVDVWFPADERLVEKSFLCEKGRWNWLNTRNPDTGEYTPANNPYGGGMRLVRDPLDPSRLCLEMTLTYAGTRPLAGGQHTKLYEVQETQASNYGESYLTKKEAYYSFKIEVPSNLNIQNKILIWQLCGELGVYGNPEHTYAPHISLSFVTWGYDALLLQVAEYYYTDGKTRKFPLIKTTDFPKDRWVTIEVYVKQGSAFRVEDGTVIVWIDRQKVFERTNLSTTTFSGTPYVIWGIGNYGSRLELYGTKLYFKDVSVSGEAK